MLKYHHIVLIEPGPVRTEFFDVTTKKAETQIADSDSPYAPFFAHVDDIEKDFSSQILVDTVNKTGVLAEVAAVIADSGSNIEEVAVVNRHQDTSAMTFLLQVKDRTHLARIMRNVKNMPNVKSISRDSA